MRKILANLVLAGTLALGLTGCGLVEKPYTKESLANALKEEEYKSVSVQGKVISVGDYDFTISKGTNKVVITRGSNGATQDRGDYSILKPRLFESMKKADGNVTVYGFIDKGSRIEKRTSIGARYVDVEGTLYPIYK